MPMNNLSHCPNCGSKMPSQKHKNNESARAKASRMIAQHLVFSLQIRQGNQLVLLLGRTGAETDNLDAIASWVLPKLECYEEWPIPTSQAVELVEDIERELKTVLQDIAIGWM